jgi:hypothetical protein
MIFFITKAYSQNFMQYYNLPDYYNPAFVGNAKCSSIVSENNIHYLKPGLVFIKNMLLSDIYISPINSGLKLSAEKYNYPDNVFSSMIFSFAYSYHFRISRQKKVALSAQINYNANYFNPQNLIFPDMIDYFGIIGQSNENISQTNTKKIFFDGAFAYFSPKIDFGFSIKNLYSIYTNEKYKYSMSQINTILNYKNIKIYYNWKADIKFFANYIRNTGIDVYGGLITKYNNFELGMILKQNINMKNYSYGIEMYAGIRKKHIKIAYSADIYGGKLFLNKSMINELYIAYLFFCGKKIRNKAINCPAYEF